MKPAVKVNPLKLRMFSLTFGRNAIHKDTLFAWLYALLKETMGGTYYKTEFKGEMNKKEKEEDEAKELELIARTHTRARFMESLAEHKMELENGGVDGVVVHKNPKDQVICAEAIDDEIKNLVKKEDSGNLYRYLDEWVEAVKKDAERLKTLDLRGYKVQLNKCVRAGYMTNDNEQYKRAGELSNPEFTFILCVIWCGDRIVRGKYVRGDKFEGVRYVEDYFGIENISKWRNRVAELKNTEKLEEIYNKIRL